MTTLIKDPQHDGSTTLFDEFAKLNSRFDALDDRLSAALIDRDQWHALAVETSGTLKGLIVSHRKVCIALARSTEPVQVVIGDRPISDVRCAVSSEQVKHVIPSALKMLSKREREIATWVVKGTKPKAIAAELGISRHTVLNHIKNMYRKLGAHSRSELICRLLGSICSGEGEAKLSPPSKPAAGFWIP